jgi:hypothetical protein
MIYFFELWAQPTTQKNKSSRSKGSFCRRRRL